MNKGGEGPVLLKRLFIMDNLLYSLENFFCVTFGTFMVSATFIEVVIRKAFSLTLLVGISEIINWVFVWFVIFGCAALVKLKGHITIDYFVQRLIPQKFHYILVIVINIIIMVFLIYVIITGLIFSLGQLNILATAANIPKTYVYLSTSIGMTFMFFHIMVQTVEKIYSVK
jgi:TRAP-type C4-dicarboxylate transport system permease small subunit